MQIVYTGYDNQYSEFLYFKKVLYIAIHGQSNDLIICIKICYFIYKSSLFCQHHYFLQLFDPKSA